jgi:predicted nucleic acid-binding protein
LITFVETKAALAAGRRGRYWTAHELGRLLREWEAAWAEAVVINVDPLIAVAAALAQEEPLSGCDAIHLAAATVSGCDIFVAADRRLCDAARSQRLKVLDLDQDEAPG